MGHGIPSSGGADANGGGDKGEGANMENLMKCPGTFLRASNLCQLPTEFGGEQKIFASQRTIEQSVWRNR
jgi:hypothetical protein